jgi:hypothetical protein
MPVKPVTASDLPALLVLARAILENGCDDRQKIRKDEILGEYESGSLARVNDVRAQCWSWSRSWRDVCARAAKQPAAPGQC